MLLIYLDEVTVTGKKTDDMYVQKYQKWAELKMKKFFTDCNVKSIKLID